MADEPSSIIVDPGMAEPKDPLLGQLLGGYQVQSQLGAGGMGTVYLAQHQRIGRKAAVKVLQGSAASDDEWKKRFLTEAEALASLKHRNLVDVYEFGDLPDGRQYLMMEYLEGEPLDRYIAKHAPLPPAQALGIAEQVLNGLGEAHKKGIVHRDLKPANVMLLREHSGEFLVKLLDFGLARQNAVPLASLAQTQRSEAASMAAGTPEYIAPEQAQAHQVDGTADLYSLGVMLFEMLSGRLPFQSDSVSELLQKHLSERPPALSSLVEGLPEGVEEFVGSLLEKDPLTRPQTADLARQTVQRLLKRMAAEATTVRGRAPPSAPTQKVNRPAPPTDVIRPVRTEGAVSIEPRGPTTDVELPQGAKPNRTPVVLGVLVLIILLLGFAVSRLGSGAEQPVAQVEPVKVAPPRPEPKVEPPPRPVEPEPTPLVAVQPEPEPKPEKRADAGLKARPKVLVVLEKKYGAECEADGWKKNLERDLEELNQKAAQVAATNPDFLDVAERQERTLSVALSVATTSDDCLRAMGLRDDFGTAIKKASKP